MNEHSSRGHTILTIYIEIEAKTVGENGDTIYITRHGKINFVDLAGSEMVKKTNSVGKALTEASNINKSLMVSVTSAVELEGADLCTHNFLF